MAWAPEFKSTLIVVANDISKDTQTTYSPSDAAADHGYHDIERNNITAPKPKSSYFIPQLDFLKQYQGSKRLAFSSHACFLTAASCYVKLGCLDLAWLELAKNVPNDVFRSGEEEIWTTWADTNNDEYIVHTRESYLFYRSFWYTVGAYFLVLVGLFDLMRYGSCINIFMILAGVSGIMSGLSSSMHSGDIFDCISVHLYFLEAINILRREHHYMGWQKLFRLSDFFFMSGAILDILDSYGSLNGYCGLGLYISDIIAALLWLGCAIIDVSAEIYFLPKNWVGDELGCSTTYYIGRI